VNQSALGAAHGPWRLSIFDTLGSTSDFCIARAGAGEPGGLAALARRQDKGRGRNGRPWTSSEGNLFLSVLLRPEGPARDAGLWSMLAGVALMDALSEGVAEPGRLALKWPNDVLLDGRKLAGILVDSAAGAGAELDWLVVGIGANLAVAPDLPDRVTACLAEFGPPPVPEIVARAILGRLDHWGGLFQAAGFAPIRAAWLDRAQPVGTPVTLKLLGREWAGRFAGLGVDGSMRLNCDGEIRHFAAGEVVMGEAARGTGG
jgi:BirA family biotin operon repressor/biotin-[acetyl-CoA-carboxylase] ligase